MRLESNIVARTWTDLTRPGNAAAGHTRYAQLMTGAIVALDSLSGAKRASGANASTAIRQARAAQQALSQRAAAGISSSLGETIEQLSVYGVKVQVDTATGNRVVSYPTTGTRAEQLTIAPMDWFGAPDDKKLHAALRALRERYVGAADPEMLRDWEAQRAAKTGAALRASDATNVGRERAVDSAQAAPTSHDVAADIVTADAPTEPAIPAADSFGWFVPGQLPAPDQRMSREALALFGRRVRGLRSPMQRMTPNEIAFTSDASGPTGYTLADADGFPRLLVQRTPSGWFASDAVVNERGERRVDPRHLNTRLAQSHEIPEDRTATLDDATVRELINRRSEQLRGSNPTAPAETGDQFHYALDHSRRVHGSYGQQMLARGVTEEPSAHPDATATTGPRNRFSTDRSTWAASLDDHEALVTHVSTALEHGTRIERDNKSVWALHESADVVGDVVTDSGKRTPTTWTAVALMHSEVHTAFPTAEPNYRELLRSQPEAFRPAFDGTLAAERREFESTREARRIEAELQQRRNEFIARIEQSSTPRTQQTSSAVAAPRTFDVTAANERAQEPRARQVERESRVHHA